MGKVKDLTDQKFERLTVIERDYEKEKIMKSRNACWKCLCICGNYISVSSNHLKSGNVKSCGCLNSELVINRSKKYNTYNLTGEYGIGYTSKGEEFYFDLEDYDKIKDYCWCIDKNGYVVARINGKVISFHKTIIKTLDNEIIDHIFGNTNDNRKKYLRIVTKAQNAQNSKLSIRNKSGRKGVREYSPNLWCYEIRCNKKKESKFGYKSYEEAVKAREEAEIRLHGEYRRINDIKENKL